MHRYQILIEYVGTNFIGWQIQSKGKSIQKLIQKKLSKLLKEKILLIGSGRTDAGVHATEQSAHFECKKEIQNLDKFLKSVNHFVNDMNVSIMNLEKETGVSIMRIGEKLDTGPVCNSYKIEIISEDNSETIAEKLSALAAEKILENIDEILDGKIEFKEQNHKKASYATKIEKKEGQIEWGETAENIIGKINGLYPSPGAFFIYNGERYKILQASLSLGSGEIGEVLDNYLEISCGNKKSIKVLEIQRQGKRPQNISEFMLGSQIKKGSKMNNA